MAEETPSKSPEAGSKPEGATITTANDHTKAGSETAPATSANGNQPAQDTEKEMSAEKSASTPEPGTTNDSAPKDAADAVPGEDAGAPAGAAKDGAKRTQRRKSAPNMLEHKAKKGKRKSERVLHLDVQPGQYWYARMKGHPPWPAIICDEEMLPEILLAKRPVSAARPDGSYREDFLVGGKSVKDRRYPIMFLGTNEFAWHVNTDLDPLDMDELKSTVRKGDPKKKQTKLLWQAFETAAEGHDLQHFKKVLREHEEATRLEEERRAEEEAKKAAKQAAKREKEEKSKRKSRGAVEEDDEMLEDQEESDAGARKTKPSGKKRKKDLESDGEAVKAVKTPKKIKVNGPKPPADESTARTKKTQKRRSTAKAKQDNQEPVEVAKVETAPTEEELDKRRKTILYIRHKLQKGFLTRDSPPKESEMDLMADFFFQLEQAGRIEADIIRATKVHKVLKGILKLESIPREDEFHFKTRSNTLLASWNDVLSRHDPEGKSSAPPETNLPRQRIVPTTNGVRADGSKSPTEESAGNATKSAEPKESTPRDADPDVSMAEAEPAPA